MICPACRVWVPSDTATCATCGEVVRTGRGGFALVLPDNRRVRLEGCVTLGRSDDSMVHLTDPSVSRHHARILAAIDPPIMEDTGSSNGSFVNGVAVRPSGAALADGVVIHLGDAELRVERVRADEEPWPGNSAADADDGSVSPGHLRLRPGVTVRRADVGRHLTYTVYGPEGRDLVRVDGLDVDLLERIDGRRSTEELVRDARRTRGAWGVGRLIQLIALLAERGLLDGATAMTTPRPGRLRRLLAPREVVLPGAGAAIATLYRRGGFLLFTAVGLVLLAGVAVAGLAAFVALFVQHRATPMVVNSEIFFGAPVFIAGRLLGVVAHETAHGLALASHGHVVPRAGVTFIAGFPFGFVDSSPAWLESRRRRLAVGAAGPSCDVVLGGLFSLVALAIAPGLGSELAFQLALAAYVGAAVNLNPMLERDGHHLLEDLVNQPGLRRRATARIAAIVSGRPADGDRSSALVIYGIAALLWTVFVAGLIIVVAIAVESRISAIVSLPVLWTAVVALVALVLTPLIPQVVRPLAHRLRREGAHA